MTSAIATPPGSRPVTIALHGQVESAREAGLRYVTDDRPGITRRRSGRSFSYRDQSGALIVDRAERERIRAIGIPPAWTAVWICPNPRGHIQATGRDARGRKQYRYHPLWRAARDATKFERLLDFGRALPILRERVAADLALRGMPREKVLGAAIWMIDRTLIRVGNEEYARANNSYGATTLRNDHVEIEGIDVVVEFRGKHGKSHRARFRDRRVASIMRRCQDLPGEELFSYVDELGRPRSIDSSDVNDYLREVAGDGFTVKDFRTWGATALCYGLLCDVGRAESQAEAAQLAKIVVKLVAAQLGNTPAVCRASYIHPAILSGYNAGTLALRADREDIDPVLRAEERHLLTVLETIEA